MNFKINSIWFVTTLLLATAFAGYVYNTTQKEKTPIPKDEIIDLTNGNGGDSLYTYYAPYIGYVKAIKLRTEGKLKESRIILATLSKSQNEDIRKIANLEIKQFHPTFEKELIAKPSQIDKKEKAATNAANLDSVIKSVNPSPVIAAKEPTSQNEIKTNPNNGNKLGNSTAPLKLTSAKGSKFNYTGDVQDGSANGNGVGIYESGSVYKGTWKNNQRDGKGEFKWKDGERYHGDFSNDFRQGQGTYYWKNGDYYVGGWKQDKRHGFGTLFKANGKIKKKGIWENDELVKETH
jgi:hypothetical protein